MKIIAAASGNTEVLGWQSAYVEFATTGVAQLQGVSIIHEAAPDARGPRGGQRRQARVNYCVVVGNVDGALRVIIACLVSCARVPLIWRHSCETSVASVGPRASRASVWKQAERQDK
eukprot:CAMPEP_0180795186 /NCGR_PEP_ID=MMETSP1038_2-20121128/56062_1 /TAXON_ID=632150 /ORGANISM="Azadinium spinosum, Strain 3D9" /LENGTH=116 /DNA_ID=CAMNT_0022834083 /DNA_START=601 /DNA_END=951 /DNA_ORIENTATION=-